VKDGAPAGPDEGAGRRAIAGWIVAGAVFVVGVGTCAVRSWSKADVPAEPSAKPAEAPEATSAATVPTKGARAATKRAPPPRSGPPRFAETLDVSGFLRGNLHTHSNRSDGDSPPADVYAFYRDHGYAFVVLSDHNTRTDPAEHRALLRHGFVMIPGEEVTMSAAGKPVHINAICTRTTIGGGPFATAREALEWGVARTVEQGAIALVNHPNFGWALSGDDLPAADGAALLEVWSGHPHVNTQGDLLRPSHEALWTAMLDAGEAFAAVAVDDMHYLSPSAKEPAARPLRGWVEVFGSQATEEVICDGLRRGRLYASSGPKLSRIRVKDTAFAITVAAPARVEILGAEGAVLAEVDAAAGKEVRYELRGGERYVRARITGRDGKRAWTQAYQVE
jgi:hypothetical protein